MLLRRQGGGSYQGASGPFISYGTRAALLLSLLFFRLRVRFHLKERFGDCKKGRRKIKSVGLEVTSVVPSFSLPHSVIPYVCVYLRLAP